MTDRYLMCSPDHFDVSYVINPWMKGNVALARNDVARRQWQTLAAAIEEVAIVERITPREGVPDMVFTANAGLILGNTFVLSRFRHPERQAEEPYFAEWFAKQGYKVERMPESIPFEGAGDALLDRAQPLLWMGHGHRTNLECASLLSDFLDIEVQPLRLVDERFYHLDTCFCPLQDGSVMYYPAAFDEDSQARIAARVPAKHRIIVPDADALDFACNTVNCGHHVFMNHASLGLTAELQARGFRVHQTPLTEFMKAGGSAKCLTLKLNEVRIPATKAAA